MVALGEKNAPRVSAAHVQCDASKLNTTVRILKALFNRGRDTDVANLPGGRVFRFCEHHSKFKNLDRVRHCRIMQRQFMSAHTSAIIHGVMDLDHAVDLGGADGMKSLRELLLGMKSTENEFWPLFIAIDYDTFRDEICAVVHINLMAEASHILSYLPVYLHARFGAHTGQWFSLECKQEMSKFVWHEDEHRVVCLDDEDSLSPVKPPSTAPFADWENVDEADVELSTTKLKIDLPALFNFEPRDGHGTGSGFADSALVKSMVTNTSQLTTVLGSFTDPILLY